MAREDGKQIPEPGQSLFRRDDVNDTVFAAVEFRALLPRFFDGRSKKILKVILRSAAFGIGIARADIAVRRFPVCALMGEDMGLIEVEIVDHTLVIGRVQGGQDGQ